MIGGMLIESMSIVTQSILSYVRTADVLLKVMVIAIENTAHGNATANHDGRWYVRMDNKTFRALALYKTTMALVKNMLKKELISTEEYAEIDTIIAKKYGLNSSVIYR